MNENLRRMDVELSMGDERGKRKYQFGQSLKHSKNEAMGFIHSSSVWVLFSKKAQQA